MPLVGRFGCLKLCLYGTRELAVNLGLYLGRQVDQLVVHLCRVVPTSEGNFAGKCPTLVIGKTDIEYPI